MESGLNSEVEEELPSVITGGSNSGTNNKNKKEKNKLPIPNKKDLDPRRLSRHNWRDLLTVSFVPGNLLPPDIQQRRAPAGWSVCRDCAVRHMVSSTSTSTAAVEGAGDDSSDCSSDDKNAQHTYCPLSLTSVDPQRVREAIEAIISSSSPCSDGSKAAVTILDEQEVLVNDPALGMEGISPWLDVLEYSIVDILAGYFYDGGSIGRVLQEAQRRRMGKGVQGGRVYVRMWMRNKEEEDEGNYEVHIECKVGGLGDCDKEEDGEEREGEVEEKLVRGGWYLGRGQGVNGKICRE